MGPFNSQEIYFLNQYLTLFSVTALFCHLIKSHSPHIKKKYMILLRLNFVHNLREITDLWIADYNLLFLFFVVTCSQAYLS